MGEGDRNGQTDTQTDRQTDRQTDSQTGMPADRQTGGWGGGERERGGGGGENKNTRKLIHVYKQQAVPGRATVTS